MGIAPCLEADLAAIPDLHLYDKMAVGVDCSDRYLGNIQHAVSYHTAELEEFRKRREKAGGNLDYKTHAHRNKERGREIAVDYVWLGTEKPFSGSSAMLGVLAAIELGYEKIIVAGCPLDLGRYEQFQKGWTCKYEVIKDKVRSMSGWTAGFVGRPTEEWLKE